MSKCPNCSAPVKDDVEQCPFCNTTTAYGVSARQARAAQVDAEHRAAQERAAADAAATRVRAQAELNSASTLAVVYSLAGTILCCLFPIGPVLGVIYGRKARRLATELGLQGPGNVGYWLGVAGLGIAVLAWVGVGAITAQERTHLAELKKKVGTAEKLDLATACALTELALIEKSYEEFNSLDDYECATGDLEVHGNEAVLRNTSFKKTARFEVVSCLQLRSRWSVKQVRADDDCSAPPPEPKKKAKAKP